jgi:7-keto-8-aminopelargonate synthetase-like enzyme
MFMYSTSFRPLIAAGLLAALALCGCGQHTVQARQAVARAGAAIEAEGSKLEAATDRLDAYIGDRFADAEAALARKPVEEPAAPSF